ncbi:peptide deformylase [Lichenifustis flavocetrariae]|uniref:Peptide deformylase n=1 Tax=Lichenifustis flavocetrariae TaxID=2949735 RepID=A0AA41YV77_9HYPH|nr:peptide deformylase [Lichenifustis flavocetrariae]MCW6508739.1 peptide deformylase [Lichenifustis flavocetrariae]
MIHPIVIHPDPILHETSAPVPQVTDGTRTLLDDMLDTMYDAQGRGLAAVQIGVLQRVVVVDTDWKERAKNPLLFVNPEIVWSSDMVASREERCLSIPDTPKEVRRPDRVRVRYLDRTGAPQEMEAEGLLAMVIQHEVDHLNGVLILDRVNEPR